MKTSAYVERRHRRQAGRRMGAATTTAALCGAMLCAVAASRSFATTARWFELAPPVAIGTPTIYDSNRHRALIIGGRSIWAASSDPTPQWSKIWSGVSPVPTPATFLYDPARDRIWAFSMTVISPPFTFPGQLWTMDLGTPPLAWVQRSFSNTAPQLYEFASALDPVRDRVVLFGGNDLGCPGCESNAVRVLSLSGTPTWSAPTVTGSWYVGTAPSPRMDASAVYDPIRDRLLFYGGVHYVPPSTSPIVYDETWALSLADTMSWTFLAPATGVPPARGKAFVGCDSTGQRMIMTLGSLGGGTDPWDDTWALDLSLSIPAASAAWTQLASTFSATRPSAAVWLDPPQTRLVLYGGGLASAPRVDLWSLSLGPTPAWNALTPGSQRPPERVGHVAFSDALEQHWYVGLGFPRSLWQRSTDLEDGVPWQSLPSGGPSARYWPSVAKDSAGSSELVFGGGSSSIPTTAGTEYSDLWAYGFGGVGWSQLSPTGPPPERAEALALFDRSRRQLVIHGGRYSLAGAVRPRADTWVYDVLSNTWSAMPAGDFGGRWGEVGIYDPPRDRLVAFGGRDTAGRFADVHVLPLGPGGTWSALATAGTPPGITANFPRSIRAAHDAVRDRMIVLASGDASLRVFSLSLDANPTWSELTVNGDAPITREDYATADLASGRMLVSGGRSLGFGGGLLDDDWVLVFDETTPVLLSLVSSDASAERVRITWQAEGLASASFTAYRRMSGRNWSAVASLLPDGSGFMTLEDRNVRPGDRYDYRLGVVGQGSERYYGEVSVVVPKASVLRLEGARPNPAPGALWMAFALGSEAPATLEVVDVTGRRVLERAVGALGRGEHLLRIAEPGRLPAGLYVARLTQGGERRIAKLVIVR